MFKAKGTKDKIPYAQMLIPKIILAVVLYAIADWILIYLKGVGMSDVQTTCWYSFWTVEIVGLTAIKVSKVKKGKEKTVE